MVYRHHNTQWAFSKVDSECGQSQEGVEQVNKRMSSSFIPDGSHHRDCTLRYNLIVLTRRSKWMNGYCDWEAETGAVVPGF